VHGVNQSAERDFTRNSAMTDVLMPIDELNKLRLIKDEAINLLQKLVDVCQRSDPAWVALHNKKPVYDEEWDEIVGNAEEFLEEIKK